MVHSSTLFGMITRPGLRFSAAAAALGAGLVAAPVLACPACIGASSPATRFGYYVSTAVLSLTPLLIMGLMGTYIGFKYRGESRRRRDQVV